jgi:hypothetical protein
MLADPRWNVGRFLADGYPLEVARECAKEAIQCKGADEIPRQDPSSFTAQDYDALRKAIRGILDVVESLWGTVMGFGLFVLVIAGLGELLMILMARTDKAGAKAQRAGNGGSS